MLQGTNPLGFACYPLATGVEVYFPGDWAPELAGG